MDLPNEIGSSTLMKKSFVLLSSTSTINRSFTHAESHEKFFDWLGQQNVVECERRSEFLVWCATTIVNLHQNKLHGLGSCAILIGERGCGKTFLFNKVAEITVNFPSNMIVCYIQYKTMGYKTPLQIFVDHMKEDYKVNLAGLSSIPSLQNYLERNNKNLIFFVDGLDVIFAANPSMGCKTIEQLIEISEMDCTVRRVIVIATGSSMSLRRLCFATATENDKQNYPSYRGLSFNKYACFTIGSLLSAQELLNAKRILDVRLPFDTYRVLQEFKDDENADEIVDELDEENCMKELALTRGVIQSVIDLERQHYHSLQKFMELKNDVVLQRIWSILLQVLLEQVPDEIEKVLARTQYWDYLPTVSLHDLIKADSTISLQLLYDWYDRGFISVINRLNLSDYQCYRVTFAHGLDFMWAFTNLSHTYLTRISFGNPRLSPLTALEEVCFLNPAGTDLHERSIAEALAYKYELTLPGLASALRFEYEYKKLPLLLTYDKQYWNGELYKVDLDNGADFIAFHDTFINDKPILLVSLMQCKLTQNEKARLYSHTSSGSPNISDINDRLEYNKLQFKSKFTCDVLQGRQLHFQKFLICPHLISQNVRNDLQTRQIRLIGRDVLAQCWNPSVINFISNGGQHTSKIKFLLNLSKHI